MKEEQDMEAIKIHERELRDIIRESVCRILDEVRGALDERMRGLAETIWNRIEGGETDFVIDTQTIDKCQDYFKATKPIEVKTFSQEETKIGGYGKSELQSYEGKYILLINLSYVGISLPPIPIIMHELTHMVNAEKYKFKDAFSVGDSIIDGYYYYFRDTECNARVCEFSYYLEGKIKKGEPINTDINCGEYSEIHKLGIMRNILDTIMLTEITTNPNYVIYIGRLENMLPPDVNEWYRLFGKVKKRIYYRLWRIYQRYFLKINKVLRYAVNSQEK